MINRPSNLNFLVVSSGSTASRFTQEAIFFVVLRLQTAVRVSSLGILFLLTPDTASYDPAGYLRTGKAW